VKVLGITLRIPWPGFELTIFSSLLPAKVRDTWVHAIETSLLPELPVQAFSTHPGFNSPKLLVVVNPFSGQQVRFYESPFRPKRFGPIFYSKILDNFIS
jgi:hypothetical protein